MGLTEDQRQAALAELQQILEWLDEVELTEAQLRYLNSLFLTAIEPAGHA